MITLLYFLLLAAALICCGSMFIVIGVLGTVSIVYVNKVIKK